APGGGGGPPPPRPPPGGVVEPRLDVEAAQATRRLPSAGGLTPAQARIDLLLELLRRR
ncbi:MAG: hypothetical protein RL722_704, partial [Pseudomonadota bacterium]